MAASSPATTPPADLAPPEEPRLPHRVTIIGGGFAGLYAARNLGIDPEVRVTLIDRRNFHLFQPMLYQVATGALSPGDIAQPLRSILRKQRNTTVILGEAVGIDVEKRQVLLSDGGPVDYDTLIVATGAHHTYFDHPEWAPLAPGLKTIEDATRDPPPDPDRVRGRRARGRPGTAGRVDDVRDRRRRADRRRARRRARRDRARHAQARLPGDPSGRREDHRWSRRWTACCRRTRPGGRHRPSASWSGSASRSARRPGSSTSTTGASASSRPRAARRRSRPGPSSGPPASRRRRSRGRWRRRPGPRPIEPGGSSSSPT